MINFQPDVEDMSHVYTEGWSDIRWLCNLTTLPVVIKGILTPEDARLARDNGAAAVLVSNHGGRELDSGIATV